MLGAGEGRQLISGQVPLKSFNARGSFDIFRNRQVKKPRREGLWARM